jgi:hypothetical protein
MAQSLIGIWLGATPLATRHSFECFDQGFQLRFQGIVVWRDCGNRVLDN